MAQQLSVSVYQINSQAPIPLASVTPISFPTGSIIIRGVGSAMNLSTGVRVYSVIQTASNDQYYAMQSQATLVTAANA